MCAGSHSTIQFGAILKIPLSIDTWCASQFVGASSLRKTISQWSGGYGKANELQWEVKSARAGGNGSNVRHE